MLTVILGLLGLLQTSFAFPTELRSCPPVKGDFDVTALDLYPESADWDPIHCKLYLGATYNASFVIYDPYEHTHEVIFIPGVTNNPEYEISGVDYDPYSGSVYFCVTSSTAFSSTITQNESLADFSGPNGIVKYDTTRRQIDFVTSFVPIQQQILKKTGKLINGFQDMAEDARGNSYALATFGNVLVKVDPFGAASVWYESPQITDVLGFEGIFSLGDKLVVSNRLVQGFVTFDTTAEVASPVVVRPKNLPGVKHNLVGWDGLYAPTKYCNRIALSADDLYGTRVFGSMDNWDTAEYLGGIPLPDNLHGGPDAVTLSTDIFEIGDTIYALASFFQYPHTLDPSVPISRRKNFPMTDITDNVDGLVKAWSKEGCCK